jgi:hypothetical protein
VASSSRKFLGRSFGDLADRLIEMHPRSLSTNLRAGQCENNHRQALRCFVALRGYG